MRKSCKFLILLLLVMLPIARSAYADNIGLIFRGVAKTIYSVLQIPAGIIKGGPRAFPLGLIGGTIEGSMKAVAGTINGAADIARGAAPYAKYAVFFM